MDPKFVERVTYIAIAAIALAAGYLFAGKSAPVPPQAQPSVPSLIPPPCNGSNCQPDCSGNQCPARRRHNPFRVACPNCRSTLTVQEPESSAVGEVVGESQAAK